MTGIVLGSVRPDPELPALREEVASLRSEITQARAEAGALRQFRTRIETDLATPGHVTKAEVRAALADLAERLNDLGK